jgi:hypothetical protein
MRPGSWSTGPRPFFLPYSPNVGEEEFSEVGLPLYGVLRSSHRASGGGIMLLWKGLARRFPQAGQKGGSVKRCTQRYGATRA